MVEQNGFWPQTRDVRSWVERGNLKTVAGLRTSQEKFSTGSLLKAVMNHRVQ